MCPSCQIHEPWVHCQRRLDEAFGAEWALTPAPWNPMPFRDGNIVYQWYVLWIRGSYVDAACGSHEEFRKTGNIGDAMESTRGNAMVRCCKHKFSTNLDLWELRKRYEYRKAMAASLKAKHAPSGAGSSSPSDPAPTLSYGELLAEIKKELLSRYPSQNNADVEGKKNAIRQHWGCTWNELIEMPAERIAAGLASLRR